jgi:hypothetical protein
MSNLDRVARIILATIFAYLYFSGTVAGVLGIVLVVLGAIFVLTSVISSCPVYSIFGLSTCSTKQGT